MSLQVAILAGLLAGLGLAMTAQGWAVAPRPRRRRRLPLSRARLVRTAIALTAGQLVWLATGWFVAAIAVPAAVLGLPLLLAAPSRSPISRLEALEEWTRGLAGVLTVGVGLEQAIIATARSAPAAIAPEVNRLAARLTARTSTETALRRFGDDLNDATGDLVVMSLLLAASRRGTGLSSVLGNLAASVSEEARIRRAVDADQAKLRTAARWITGITVVVLAALFLNGTYVAPYRSPGGQVLLTVLLSGYAGALVWLRSLAAGSTPSRLLVGGGQP